VFDHISAPKRVQQPSNEITATKKASRSSKGKQSIAWENEAPELWMGHQRRPTTSWDNNAKKI